MNKYDTLVKAIKDFSNHRRLAKFGKQMDPNKMDVDAIEQEGYHRREADWEQDEPDN